MCRTIHIPHNDLLSLIYLRRTLTKLSHDQFNENHKRSQGNIQDYGDIFPITIIQMWTAYCVINMQIHISEYS